MILRSTLLLAALGTLTASIAAAAAPIVELPTVEWRAGPVRYIITAEEDERFQSLTTDAERRRFIAWFWARRDPDPRTFVNEFRHTFWERVVTANTLFTESAKPGWKTDMGRFFILLGPPDDRDTSREFGRGFGQTGNRGAIIWRYSHAPTARVGTGVTLVFTRDASGEYRTSTDPGALDAILSDSVRAPAFDSVYGVTLPEMPPSISELELMLDLGRLEDVPSEDDLLTAIVTAEEFYGVIPFSARYDFFAGRSSLTIAAITLNLHPDPFEPVRASHEPDYLIVGRLDPIEVDSDSSNVPLFLHERSFAPSAHNTEPGYRGPYIYQAVIALPPGRYRISFAAFDKATRKTGSYTDTIDVPLFSEERLSLSSLCLSESIEPAPAGADPAPYVIGHLKVTPRLIPAYRNGDTFAVYYQVYSALTDPTTRSTDLVIEYQFLVEQGGAFAPIGRPIRFDGVSNSAQGWSFPLHNWPSAEFLLRVTVTDSLTGQVASGEVPFRVL